MPADPDSVSPNLADPVAPQPIGEEVFRLLVEAVQDYAIFLLSPDGHVRTWNLGAERAKGYSADEIIGQHFSVFYTPEDRAVGRPDRLLRQAASEGTVEDEGWRLRKDGSRFWADVVLTALRDPQGALYGFAKVTRDLTERRAAAKQEQILLIEQRARAAAEEALLARNRFLSIASHELKTPVASLQLAAESIVRARDLGRLDQARLGTGLGRILTATRRLASLVDELLDVSSLASDSLPPNRAPTNVVALVAEVIARFADAGEARVRLDAPAAVTIKADAPRLDQVVTNLVDNALKYSDAEAVVEVAVSEGPDGVTIIVADRGIGLDQGSEARLFEAFSRGDNAAHVQGLGLGLFISHQIVERHGGSIEAAEGPDGIGSVFRVWLPKDEA
jgi:PAS domain S-box-containing protein